MVLFASTTTGQVQEAVVSINQFYIIGLAQRQQIQIGKKTPGTYYRGWSLTFLGWNGLAVE
jgi:hypothetical protein